MMFFSFSETFLTSWRSIKDQAQISFFFFFQSARGLKLTHPITSIYFVPKVPT